MSIASGFRHKWGVVMRAFDASQGGTDDHRFAVASKAADEADLMLIEKRAFAALTETIARLRASQAGGDSIRDTREFRRGVEAAAKLIDSKVQDYTSEHGAFDPETGATEFSRAGEEYVSTLEELSEEIRNALSASPPPPATDGDALREALRKIEGGYLDEEVDEDDSDAFSVALQRIARNALASSPPPVTEIVAPHLIIAEAVHLNATREYMKPWLDAAALASSPPLAATDAVEAERVIADIAAERRRQVAVEGWTPGHDDKHEDGEIACAAAAYCISGSNPKFYATMPVIAREMPAVWPWSFEWWKPKGARHDLVRAGALIVAEIERLDRTELRARGTDEVENG